MITVIFSLALLTVVRGDFLSEVDAETRLWCAKVQAAPEPEILVYNMVPKTASTTLRAHVEKGAKDKVLFFMHGYKMFSDGERIRDLDKEPALAHQFRKGTLEKLEIARSQGKKLFTTGHFSHHVSDFTGITVEAINTVRECRSRSKSRIQFDLFTSPNAVNWARKFASNETKRDIWLTIMLFANPEKKILPIEPWSCARDPICLHKSRYAENGYDNRFLTGYKATLKHGGNPFDASIRNINTFDYNVGGFTYIGVTEQLEQTIAVLECLYPSYFPKYSAVGMDVMYNAHNSTALSREFMSLPTVKDLIENTMCTPDDDRVYQEALRLHSVKYHAATTFPQFCCRK